MTPTTALAFRRATVDAGIVHVDLAGFDGRDQIGGQRLGIDLEPQAEGHLGTHAWPDTAQFLAHDRLGGAAACRPRSPRTECVETKDAPTFIEHALRVLIDGRVEAGRRSGVAPEPMESLTKSDGCCQRNDRRDKGDPD